MARFKIISKDGSLTRYEGRPKYAGSYLRPSYLEFTEISSPTPIAWEVGDYVDYPRTGMRYRLYSIPQPSKNARKESYGGAFTYSNVQLYAATKELDIALFKDVVTADNNIHFSSSPDVATFEDISGIARRIQACMDLLYPDRWIIRVADGLSDEAKEFALSGGTCLDALSRIYEIWEDTGWFHSYDEATGKEVITIGYANSRNEGNTTDPYLYGKGNGLTAIKKNQTNKDEFATRLYVFGSDRNLPARYYNDQDILNGESLDIRHLMIPTFQWGRTDGKPDARKAYLENIDARNKYGVIPKTHYFDSDDAGGNIYPTIEGITISQLRAALTESGESAYYPSASKYPDPNERIDEVLVGDNITDDGVGKVMGKNYTSINYFAFDDTFAPATIPQGTKAATIVNHVILSHTFSDSGRGTISIEADSVKGVLYDAGFASVKLKVELTDDISKNKTVSSILESDLTKADSEWAFQLPSKISADYDMQEYESFRAMLVISFDVTFASETQKDLTTECYIESGNYVAKFIKALDTTFAIEVKQLGFDINEAASNGKGKTIAMKTGMCAGREFKITDAKYNSARESWTLTCSRQKDDTLGMLFPNEPYKIQPGDQFVLLDIAMPEILISIAANRLLSKGLQLLYKVSKIQSHYEPMIDAKLMHESKRVLREGMYMELSDEDVIENGTAYVLIDTLNIREDDSNIPTYSVTLRERRKVSYKGTPSATSHTETESAEEATQGDLSKYATKEYVQQAVRQGAGGASGVTALSGLEDVSIKSLSDGEYLQFDQGDGKWKNKALDTEMSETSENPVQNKVIKAYVDGKAAEAQAAAEQYIQNEVLTYYATTKYVEGLVNDLEKEIDGRGYLTSAAMNGYATKEDIKNFVTKGTTLAHYGITDAMQVIHYPYAVVTESNPNSVGYATWKTTGPYLRVGNQNNYLLINSEMKGGHPIIWAENVLNGVEQGWTRLVDTGYLGTLAIEVAPASPGNTRPTTSPTAFCTYAYSDNGWKTTGPALAFPNGNYKALLNVGIYDPSTTDNGTTAYLGIVYGGVQSKWSKILTEHNISQYAITQSSGDDRYLKLIGGTLTGQIYIETSAGDRFIHSKCSTAHIAFGVGSGGNNRGIFDINDGKWWIVRNNSDYTEIVSSTMYLRGKVKVADVLEAQSGITLGNVTRTSWPTEGIAKGSILLPNNAFDNFGKIQFSQLDNALYAAYERYTVDVSGFSSLEPNYHRRLFDGSYEGDYNKVLAGGTGVITIGDGVNPIIKDAGYPYGDIFLSFYYTNIPESATVEVYSTYEPHGIGWHTLSRKEVRGSNGGVWIYNNTYFGITRLRITVNASATIDANLVEIDWFLTRAVLSNLPVVTKFAIDQELWGRLICKGGITLGSKTITSWDDIKASGDYLPLTGGTINGNLTINGQFTTQTSLASVSLLSNTFNVNASLKVQPGWNLYLNGEAIMKWDDLKIKEFSQTVTSGTVSIKPNVLNKWSNALAGGTLTIAFESGKSGIANYYMIEFKTGNTVPTITLPSGITWQDGDNLLARLEPNKTYQISVLNNLAVGGAF